MIRKKNGNVEWLEFELLADEPNIVHGCFLRHGGVSQGSFATLNTLQKFGDDAANIQKNRALILESLQLEKLVAGNHMHHAHIEHIQKADERELECDGLMTRNKNLGLLVTHADCQSAIFYDPIAQAIANIHAGWRGQVKNIYREATLRMNQVFDSKPENLLVCISPSLGPQNSEFKNYTEEFPQEFWPFQIKPAYFDLWAIARHQLESCGILPHHIQIAEMDTYSNSSDFYSYRRERACGRTEKITGGHGTIVGLKPLFALK